MADRGNGKSRVVPAKSQETLKESCLVDGVDGCLEKDVDVCFLNDVDGFLHHDVEDCNNRVMLSSRFTGISSIEHLKGHSCKFSDM